MTHHLDDSVCALTSALVTLRQEQEQGALLKAAADRIANWRAEAYDRLMFQEGAIRAGAYVWRRIARPLVDVKWRTTTRAEFALEVIAFARLALKAQGGEVAQGAKWPRAECEKVEAAARAVARDWTVCKRHHRRRQAEEVVARRALKSLHQTARD